MNIHDLLKSVMNQDGKLAIGAPSPVQAPPADSSDPPHPQGMTYQDVETGKVDKTDYYWSLMSDADRDYALTSPPKDRCPWCTRICGHHLICPEVLDAHEVRIPFGKYRGTLVRDLPIDYLEWLYLRGVNLTEEVRAEVNATLTYHYQR